MFFFIGGVQPKTVELDTDGKRCPSCGLYQARLKRVDHYLSLFFIPILRVKRGTPFLQCGSCGSIFDESGKDRTGSSRMGGRRCLYCGKPLEEGFRFCPSCGKPAG